MSYISNLSRNKSNIFSRDSNGQHHFLSNSQQTDASHSNFVDDNQINIHNNAGPSDITNTLHATLRLVNCSGFNVRPCMERTRRYIFKEIDRWLDDLDAPNILLLQGDPGAGKSTIASSLIRNLIEQSRLGSSFFFRRGDITLSDPAALWRTVAYDLARRDHAFHDNLVGVLKARENVAQLPDIKLHFKHLVEEPLIKTYAPPIRTSKGLVKFYKRVAKACWRSTRYNTPVIVTDALDECESDRSQASQRKDVLDTLAKWSHLPKHFKLVVTSRNEGMSESFLALCQQISLASGMDVTAQVNKDIYHFFDKEFADLPCRSSGWPSKQDLYRSTSMAAGLFIWAETVMRLLEEEGELPAKQLELILVGNVCEQNNLTALYRQIVLNKFERSALHMYKIVVTAIVLAKSPFHHDDLHLFLSQDKADVDIMLSKLSSVISIGEDQRIRIRHLSFREFLCDSHRCPAPFLIDCAEYQGMAMCCFQQMKELKFNMCDLETSCVANIRVNNIKERIQMKI